MTILRLETRIAAPLRRCFDLSRDVEVHQRSVAFSRERVVGGVTSGKLELGDSVTWQATHFGITFRLTSQITEFDPPRRFVDEMVKGPFRRLRHLHEFARAPDGGTGMTDMFEYAAPYGILGWFADGLVLRRYMRQLLEQRNAFIKRAAEANPRMRAGCAAIVRAPVESRRWSHVRVLL